MTSRANAPNTTAAHHRSHPLGGVLPDRAGRRDADALNKDVRQHDSGERESEDPGARRVRRQVAAEVGGVAGPRHREAERDGHLEDERTGKVGAVHARGCDDLVPANEFHREHHERHEQHHGQHRLQPVDQLIAEETDGALHPQHDQHRDPERDIEQHGQGFPAEQPDKRVPRDRRQPLQGGGQYDAAAERHPRVGQLTGARARTPRRQVADHK